MAKIHKTLFCTLSLILSMCLLSSCGGVSSTANMQAAVDSVASSNAEVKNPLTLADFNGSWEGTFEDTGLKVILDCASDFEPYMLTASIIDERMNFYYIEPVEYSITNDILKISWNDAPHTINMTFKFNEKGEFISTYYQYGTRSEAVFKKVSDKATVDMSQIKPQENLMDILAQNDNFDRPDAVPVEFKYIMDDPRLTELKEKYNLEDVAGGGDTQSKVLNLLKWVGEHTNFDWESTFDGRVNSLDLLDYAYDKESNGLRFSALSVILTEACLSVGIKARSLDAYSKDPDYGRNVHAIAYIPESQKWIMLDAAFNAYFMDSEGNLLSLMEVRQKLAGKDDIYINNDAELYEYPHPIAYLNEIAGQMYFFASPLETKFGYYENADSMELIYLCPLGADVNEWNVSYNKGAYDYWVSQNGESMSEEELKRREEKYRQDEERYRTQKNIIALPRDFWGE